MWNKKISFWLFSVILAFGLTTVTGCSPKMTKNDTGETKKIKTVSESQVANIVTLPENDFGTDLNSLGITPIKRNSFEEVKESDAILLGTPFGVKIYTDGVMIITVDTVDTEEGNLSPGEIAGLKKGDLIISIDGIKVYSNEDVAEIIEDSNGNKLDFKISRNNKIKNINVTPLKSYSSGKYKTGIWVRDSSAGIGTLTFISAKNNILCGLGHGVCDPDTENLLTINSGELVEAEILGCDKGKVGSPGELKGRFNDGVLGDICQNNETGIYGTTDYSLNLNNIIEIAPKNEVKVGGAKILATVDDTNTPQLFEVYIEKISYGKGNTKNMVVKITDQNLIEKTGGIIQGMSGSPIIQNGKLVGAVTHV